MTMTVQIERVTPAKAETWLNANKSNRKLRDGLVETYADDMRNGRWTNCPEPISFYEDGDLADGQHRLWAIVESMVAVNFPIARGLKREDGLNINTGLGRSLIDNARISGKDSGTDKLSLELVATCRGIEDGEHSNAGYGKRTRSNSSKLLLVQRHAQAAEWAVSNGPRGKQLRNSVVLAAIGRAWYYEKDHARLRRFSDVLASGFQQDETESASIALRNYLLTKSHLTTSALWRDTFLKAQNAVHYFMRGKKLLTIKGIEEERYPAPKVTTVKRV